MCFEGKITISKDDVENKIQTFIKDNDSQKSEIENFYKKDENKQKLAEDLINQYLFDFLDKFFINKIKESSTDIIKGQHLSLKVIYIYDEITKKNVILSQIRIPLDNICAINIENGLYAIFFLIGMALVPSRGCRASKATCYPM